MASLLSTATRLHAVSVLTWLASLISTAVVLVICTIHVMVRVTIDLTLSILVPAEQAFLLVLLPGLNPLDVLALAVNDVLPT